MRYIWGKFSWLSESLLSNEKNVYFIDSVIRNTIKEKYANEITQAHVLLFKYYSSQPDKCQFDTYKR